MTWAGTSAHLGGSGGGGLQQAMGAKMSDLCYGRGHAVRSKVHNTAKTILTAVAPATTSFAPEQGWPAPTGRSLDIPEGLLAGPARNPPWWRLRWGRTTSGKAHVSKLLVWQRLVSVCWDKVHARKMGWCFVWPPQNWCVEASVQLRGVASVGNTGAVAPHGLCRGGSGSMQTCSAGGHAARQG